MQNSNESRSVEFVIRVIDEGDMETVIKVLGRSFMSEPTWLGTDIRQDEVEEYVRLQSKEILADDLTLIAETRDGIPCGISMSVDFSSPASDAFMTYVSNHRHFKATIDMIDKLQRHYCSLFGLERDKFPRNHSVNVNMTGVDPSFRRMGVGMALRKAALEHFRSKNYRFAMSETTSLFTRKINFDCGFESKFRIPFEELYPNGEMKEKIAEGYDAVHLMVLKLS